MKKIITKNNNIGEILYKSAELRLFNQDKTARLFQCALATNGKSVKVTLAASFTHSDLNTLREVKEVLQVAGSACYYISLYFVINAIINTYF